MLGKEGEAEGEETNREELSERERMSDDVDSEIRVLVENVEKGVATGFVQR